MFRRLKGHQAKVETCYIKLYTLNCFDCLLAY